MPLVWKLRNIRASPAAGGAQRQRHMGQQAAHRDCAQTSHFVSCLWVLCDNKRLPLDAGSFILLLYHANKCMLASAPFSSAQSVKISNVDTSDQARSHRHCGHCSVQPLPFAEDSPRTDWRLKRLPPWPRRQVGRRPWWTLASAAAVRQPEQPGECSSPDRPQRPQHGQ